MKFTGNKEIDKQIKRGLGPLDPVNMDDYWDQHDTFLEHIVEVGSSDDIKLMFEENFGIDKLLRLGEDAKVILASQGYAHELLATDENENVRASVAKHCDNPNNFWTMSLIMSKQHSSLEMLGLINSQMMKTPSFSELSYEEGITSNTL